jgi:hypothetical protein
VVADRGRERGERSGVDLGRTGVGRDVDRRIGERDDLAAQPRREHLLELRDRLGRRLLDPAERVPRRGPQPDRDGDGLVVGQEQRRHGGARSETVAARAAAGSGDRVAEPAQAVDVAADRASADPEARGQLGPRPLAARLKDRQQLEQARGRLPHASILARHQDGS